jgi:hypothetical protein
MELRLIKHTDNIAFFINKLMFTGSSAPILTHWNTEIHEADGKCFFQAEQICLGMFLHASADKLSPSA